MHFSAEDFKSVIGGLSAIDLPRLSIQTLAEASAFIKVYGFDYENHHDQERLWYFHRRALVFLDEKLGYSPQEIPGEIQMRKELGDLRKLLLYASGYETSSKELQTWSCAVLRVMHVFIHCEMDLFSSFSEEIQQQILSPIQNCIVHEGSSGKILLQSKLVQDGDSVPLIGFEAKPFKTSSSTVIKLLAKREALAANVYDKLGVRFVTENMFDVFRVVRFLIRESIISTPQILPDQSSNNLYPVNVFLQACQDYMHSGLNLNAKALEDYFLRYLESNKGHAEFLRKVNEHSANDYRFVKFICRKLIRIQPGGSETGFQFYYPFEVQILDKSSYHKHQSGPSEHQAYKDRQKQAARERVFPV